MRWCWDEEPGFVEHLRNVLAQVELVQKSGLPRPQKALKGLGKIRIELLSLRPPSKHD